MAMAPRCVPAKWVRSSRSGPTSQALAEAGSAGTFESLQPELLAAAPSWNVLAMEGLIRVVQDATANPKARRKAALKIAEFLLPKVAKKAKVSPDEYGFSVSPRLASAYRDMQLELRTLGNAPSRIVPANAERIKKLEARSEAIRRRLQVPCPTRYSNAEAAKDHCRLGQYVTARDNNAVLTNAQKAEEALVKIRYDVFAYSPESAARNRRKALENAERLFIRSQLEETFYAPPLSRREQEDLIFLRRFYPKLDFVSSKDLNPALSQEALERHHDLYRDHPFDDECRAWNGNYYDRNSGLWPLPPTEDDPVPMTDAPPTSPVDQCAPLHR